MLNSAKLLHPRLVAEMTKRANSVGKLGIGWRF